jgi:hypothetical protein
MVPEIDEGLLKEALLGIKDSPVGLRDETLCDCVKEGAFEGRRPSRPLFWVSREGLCELEAEICWAREGLEEVVVGGANVEFLWDVLPSRDALGKRVSVVGLDEALLEGGAIWSLLGSPGAIVLIRALEFFLDVEALLITRDAWRGSTTSTSSFSETSGIAVMLFLPTTKFSSPSTSDNSGAKREGFPRVMVCEYRLEGALPAAYLALKAACASFSSSSNICLSAATCSIIS